MSAMSDYLEAALINHIFRGTAFSQPAGIYIALTSGVPVDATTGGTLNEISGAGYARASGKAGIIIAGQNGPGATNLVTGIAQAAKAFSPVISLSGAISLEHEGKDSF